MSWTNGERVLGSRLPAERCSATSKCARLPCRNAFAFPRDLDAIELLLQILLARESRQVEKSEQGALLGSKLSRIGEPRS